MSAFYNEIDPKAASWLRELIKRGLIADGVVDERSIEDISPSDLDGFTQCHFFAGIGAWSHALRNSGWDDDRPVWTGSCPCQPFSSAGKRGGASDERHLWPAFMWLIEQQRPSVIFGEQVAKKAGEAWFDSVQDDLESEGYSSGMVVFPACGVGAPHLRQRMYWVADSDSKSSKRYSRSVLGEEEKGNQEGGTDGGIADGYPDGGKNHGASHSQWGSSRQLMFKDGRSRPCEPGTLPLAYGSSQRVGRLRGYGNAIVAPQAQTFIESYMETLS